MKRKNLLFALLVALFMPWAAQAQEELTVCDGTTTNNYIPFYGSYVDTQGCTCEFIIPAETEGMSDMEGGTISKLTFYISNSPQTWGSPTIQVYMGEVDGTTLSGISGPTNFTTVYTGTISNQTNPLEIELTDAYTYGGGNLFIGTYVQTASSTYKSTSFYGVSAPSGSSIYHSGSSYGSATVQSFLPKTTFVYEPAATGDCEKPATLVAEDVTGNSATLTWTGGSGVYNIELNGTIIEENYEGYTYSLRDLTATTAYTAKVQSVCDGSTPTSGWKSVSFTTPCASYNIPYTYDFEDAAPFACWTPIAGVTHANSTSNAHNSTYYLKFSGTTSNLVALPQFNEATNNLRVEFWTRPESTGGNSGKFAIGYMTDITDASTFVAVETYNSTEMTTTYVKKTVDFVNVPANANIAMRQFDCSTVYYWYVDDVTVKEIPSCVAPSNLAATVSTTSAELSWTANSGETAWTLYWKESGATDYTEVANATNPYTLNGLTAATNYEFYVVANCSADDASEASELFPFVTACDVIDALGFEENFDDYTVASNYTAPSERVLPTCWSAINTTTYGTYKVFPTIYYYSSTNYANSTPNSLKFYSYAYYSSGTTTYDPQPQYAILPVMEGLAGKQVQLMARGYNASSTFKIGTMSDPTDASTFTMIAEQTLTTNYPEEAFEYIIPTNCTDSYLAIMIDAANSSRTSNGVYIDDIAIVEAPSCIKPTGLAVTEGSITNSGATITWTAGGDETNWQIEFATDADFTNPLYETVEGEPTYTFHGLDDLTTYYVHVQAVCGGSDGSSEYCAPVSFTTLQAAANLPYSNDFESENGWAFVNGNLTNAWAYGEATNNGGTHALYISNDGGITNAYSNGSAAMVYATKLFNFEAGTYVFSYDWKAYGESNYDYLRVALVPSSVILTAGTIAPTVPNGYFYNNLPTGWIALDGGGKLNLKTDWQSFVSTEIEIATAGSYMMVFAWTDDTSSGTNPPAAIDNVSIEMVTCHTPTGLAVNESATTATSVELSWTENGEATAWQIELTDEEDNVEIIDADSNPFTLRDLTSESMYAARVRAYCDEDNQSRWSEEIIFETAADCQTSDGLAAVATTNSAVISWNGYGQEEFNLRYSTDGETWTNERGVANNYMLADLTPVTTYYVQVQPTCAEEETWSESFSFTTECDVITIAQDAAYTYDFEEETPMTCWRTNVAGSNVRSSGSNNTTGGNYKLQFKGTDTGNIVAMPEFTPDINGLMLTFWTRPEGYSYSSCGTFSVGYMTDLDDASTFVPVATYDRSDWTSNTYIEKKVAFTSAPAGAYIAFCHNALATNYYWYVDDVTVEIAPTFTKHIIGYASDEEGSNGNNYYLIASPLAAEVAPTTVGGMITDEYGTDVDPTTSTYDLYSFDESEDLEWQNYRANNFNLVNGQGYLYASKEGTTLTFTGAPYSGTTKEVTLQMTENENADFQGWNLVGNPFTDLAYIDRPFYRMDATGTRVLAEEQTGAIQVMEGVFVVATVDEEHMEFSTVAPNNDNKGLVLNLSQGRGNTIDRAIVGIGQGHTLPKFMFNPNDTKLYIPQNGKDYAVVRSRVSDEIPVNFLPTEDGYYNISVDVRNMNLRSLVLKDKVRNVSIDLLRTPNYMFKASAYDRADRFVLSFKNGNGIYKEKLVKGANPEDFSFYSNGVFVIDNEGEANLQVIDMNGRVLSSENIYGSTSIQVDAAPGIYLLRLTNGDNVKVQKVVVK